MNKNMWKTTLREIRSSLGRYLAIFAIIALGVGFFSGLKVTRQAMVEATDRFVYDHSMFDYRLISTLGLTDDDVADLKRLDGVKDASGAYWADAVVDDGTQEFVVRFHSLDESINLLSLRSGRLPAASGEAVADARFYPESAIGSTVRLADDNTDETLDNFACTEYTIVGLAYSPIYLNYERGTTSVGNGAVTYFFFIPPEDFSIEAYTDIYLTLNDREFIYSDEYRDLIDALKPSVETALEERALIRYDSLYSDAEEELADARTELDDAGVKLEDAHRELDDGRREIADKEQELIDAKAEILENEEKIADGEKEIHENEQKLKDAKKDIADGERKLADAEREIRDNEKLLEDGEQAVIENEKTLADAAEELADNEKVLDAAAAEIAENEKLLDAAAAEIIEKEQLLEAAAAEISENEKLLEAAAAEIAENEKLLEAGRSELAEKEAQVLVLSQMLPADDPTLAAATMAIAAAKEQLEQGEAELAAGKTRYSEGLAALEAGKAQYEEGLAALEAGKKQYEDGLTELNAGKEQYKEGLAAFEAGKAQYEEGLAALEEAKAELASGREELEKGKEELEKGIKELSDARKEVSDGEKELEDAKTELEDGRQKISDAKTEIADGEVKLADARKELEDGEKELADKEAEYNDALDEFADAEKQLADFEKPSTYVLTRDENIGYACFENDSKIVDGIADVFPVFFFLVAALVCVTTMSRMIEEQRTQIGVLKALGYSEGSIMAKYMIYSGSAAIFGCVGGFFLGCYAFPTIIWIVYGLLYGFTDIEYVFNVTLFIISLVVSLICSVGTTYISCKHDLHMMAAELIRPKAPKNGKRILLERITFIWRRIPFLHKVSIRNVFRYKGRFIMMMLGIGGCSGLILTGFGLRDSITEIADEQYTRILVYDETVNFTDTMTLDDMKEFENEFSDRITAFMPVCQISVDPVGTGSFRSVHLITLAHEDNWKDVILLHDDSGRQLDYPKKGEVILTQNVADNNNLDIGDTITFRDSDFNEYSFTISGICENYFNSYAYIDAASYSESGQPPYKSAFVNISDDSDLHEAAAALMNSDKVGSVNINADTLNMFTKMMQSMNYIVILVTSCAAALAFIVLYNLTNINITERIREIATIKVLGFYSFETASYVFRENLALTALGSVFGIPIGIWLHNFVMSQIDIDMITFDIHINPISYLYALLFTFVFAVLVDFAMYFKLARINMAESLKSIE